MLLAFNRPQYFERVLTSLRAQSVPVDGRRVHLFQDGAVNAYTGAANADPDDIEACVRLFRAAFPAGHLHRSPWNIGPTESYVAAETLVFQELGAPLALFFEDDLELAPHYLQALAAIWEVVADEPSIGLFNAMGPHTASLEEQALSSDALVGMGHQWGYALTRDHWLRIAPYMSEYYRLTLGRTYADRPNAEIRDLFRSWGVPLSATSQDTAMMAATLAVGAWRVSSRPCLGRYIGEMGIHFRPDIYAEQRWAETELWMEPLPRPRPLTREDIDLAVSTTIAALAAVSTGAQG